MNRVADDKLGSLCRIRQQQGGREQIRSGRFKNESGVVGYAHFERQRPQRLSCRTDPADQETPGNLEPEKGRFLIVITALGDHPARQFVIALEVHIDDGLYEDRHIILSIAALRIDL